MFSTMAPASIYGGNVSTWRSAGELQELRQTIATLRARIARGDVPDHASACRALATLERAYGATVAA